MKNISKIENDFIKFHGCGIYRRDGTKVLVTKKRPCNFPIKQCFWMKPSDIKSKIRTRNSELNDLVCFKTNLKTQYKNESKSNHEYYSTEEESNTDSDNQPDNLSDTESETGYSSDRLIIDEDK